MKRTVCAAQRLALQAHTTEGTRMTGTDADRVLAMILGDTKLPAADLSESALLQLMVRCVRLTLEVNSSLIFSEIQKLYKSHGEPQRFPNGITSSTKGLILLKPPPAVATLEKHTLLVITENHTLVACMLNDEPKGVLLRILNTEADWSECGIRINADTLQLVFAQCQKLLNKSVADAEVRLRKAMNAKSALLHITSTIKY